MILETLGGGIIGGLLRLAPEVIKLFTSKADREHEIAMRKLDADIAQSGSEQRIRETEAQGNITYDVKALDALMESIKGQSAKSGIAWVDALSATVRPVITYWWLMLFSVAKLSTLTVMVVAAWQANAGDVLTNIINVGNALQEGWTVQDQSILAGIINFWFLDRVITKRH